MSTNTDVLLRYCFCLATYDMWKPWGQYYEIIRICSNILAILNVVQVQRKEYVQHNSGHQGVSSLGAQYPKIFNAREVLSTATPIKKGYYILIRQLIKFGTGGWMVLRIMFAQGN